MRVALTPSWGGAGPGKKWPAWASMWAAEGMGHWVRFPVQALTDEEAKVVVRGVIGGDPGEGGMGEPSITNAKEIATRYRKRGVAILSFSGGNFGLSSYGMTKRDCQAMRAVIDQIAVLIRDGVIHIPDTLRGEG